MLVSVMFDDINDVVLPIEVNDELRHDAFITLVLSQFNRNDTADKYTILHDGKVWSQDEIVKVEGTLRSMDIKEGSLVMLTRKIGTDLPSSSAAPAPSQPQSTAPTGNPLQNLIKSIVIPKSHQEAILELQVSKAATKVFNELKNPAERAKFQKQQPIIVTMFDKHQNDLGAFIIEFREMFVADRIKKLRALQNPESQEAQAIIEELIRNERLDKAASEAMEEIPEAFVQVQMLYFRTTLNGHDVTAFVDTGAQTTIISKSAAERCNLMKMMDTRCHIILNGVGGAKKSLGKVFKCDMIVEGHHFWVSLTVCPDDSIGMDLIFGLDLLLRHHATIDLSKRVVIFNNQATAPLLSEAEAEKLKVTREGIYGDPFASVEQSSSSQSGTSANSATSAAKEEAGKKKQDDPSMEH
ncbi:hypothetical protein WR25_26871 [Diploscapter pachys]|uniref:Peptidase A2 domain-containing protein n=1 Tax=Diploscapter pachys TaxID=2018661 RepID=A0A2A2L785_9BILA|nr:hypothetical protein WR25_26871 [Diploscapter pachys]